MNAYTPGPWKYDEEGMSVHRIGENPELGCLFGAASDHPMAIANARLIAAAPEMLEALEAYGAHADDCNKTMAWHDPDAEATFQPCSCGLGAAIAKARGEVPDDAS